jgi:hypothetical protein
VSGVALGLGEASSGRGVGGGVGVGVATACGALGESGGVFVSHDPNTAATTTNNKMRPNPGPLLTLPPRLLVLPG